MWLHPIAKWIDSLHLYNACIIEVDLREFLRPQRVLEALRALAAVRLARPLHALALAAAWDCAGLCIII